MTTKKPTPSQRAAIQYFASVADGRQPEPVAYRLTEATYHLCVERGWLVKTETFPYHAPTDEGRQVAGVTARVPDRTATDRYAEPRSIAHNANARTGVYLGELRDV